MFARLQFTSGLSALQVQPFTEHSSALTSTRNGRDASQSRTSFSLSMRVSRAGEDARRGGGQPLLARGIRPGPPGTPSVRHIRFRTAPLGALCVCACGCVHGTWRRIILPQMVHVMCRRGRTAAVQSLHRGISRNLVNQVLAKPHSYRTFVKPEHCDVSHVASH
jgi:hypothetical protein